jgi:hypothetical protein
VKRTSRGEALRRQLVSHVTVALSKAAHSGPFCCVCEREPLPLRVLDQERISALRVQLPAAGELFRSGEGCALVCGGTRAPSSPSGTRQVYSPDVKHTHGQGRTVFALPRLSFHDRPALRRAHFCVQSTAAGHCSAACAHFCVSHKALRRLHSVLLWGLCTFFVCAPTTAIALARRVRIGLLRSRH